MNKKLLIFFTIMCVLTLYFILLSTKNIQASKAQDINSQEVRIGEILFISEKGRILHFFKTGQVFNVLVLIEKESQDLDWTPFWLDIFVDGKMYASWGTGIYQGFVVYSLTHWSLIYNEPGEHFIQVSLYERIDDQKGTLIEEQTVSFTVRGYR